MSKIKSAVLKCEGKTRYTTYSEAERCAKLTRRMTDDRLVPYHCKHCNGFHIGNSYNMKKRGHTE